MGSHTASDEKIMNVSLPLGITTLNVMNVIEKIKKCLRKKCIS